jgi:hypothetical protein
MPRDVKGLLEGYSSFVIFQRKAMGAGSGLDGDEHGWRISN